MIVDITSEVYTNLKSTISNIYLGYPSINPTFPCVIFEEINNNSNEDTFDTNGEKYNDITFELNIFSESSNRLSDIKILRQKIDDVMSGLYGMNRGFSGQTPNMENSNIYRYTLRYSFLINKEKMIYRR